MFELSFSCPRRAIATEQSRVGVALRVAIAQAAAIAKATPYALSPYADPRLVRRYWEEVQRDRALARSRR